ncbi:hypothetical protein ACNHYB_04905 [Isoptericola jiangsuensis]|uniref:hypothetical protein n=1 Tax=Isoptericola jiangsuensis TaxID=548579 RepID=UPI003AAA72A0
MTTFVTDYFAAPTDALAATVLHSHLGPAAPARGSGEALFDTVRLPSIDPFVQLGSLAEVFCGRPYGEITAHPRHGTLIGGQDDGPFVVTVSDDLTSDLAAGSPQQLTDAARRWSRARGLSPTMAAALAASLLALGDLAGRACDVRHRLYCWARLDTVDVVVP